MARDSREKKENNLLLNQFSRVAKSLAACAAIVIIVHFQFRELNGLLLLLFADKSHAEGGSGVV